MNTQLTTDISLAVKIIQQGRVVAFPTGTAYGLAVDALQGHALQRLRNLKQRSLQKTFTVFMHQELWEQFLELTVEEKEVLSSLKQNPFTLLVKPKSALAHIAQDGFIGLRVIDHPIMQQLAEAVDVPLTATSANKSEQSACYDPACLQEQFPSRIDLEPNEPHSAGETTYNLSLGLILDGGQLPSNQASTIAQIDHGEVTIIRQGSLLARQIKV